jgi:hypothetical protein
LWSRPIWVDSCCYWDWHWDWRSSGWIMGKNTCFAFKIIILLPAPYIYSGRVNNKARTISIWDCWMKWVLLTLFMLDWVQ